MRDTAVEWYDKQIAFLFQQWHNHQITISEFHFKRLQLEQEAKEIEKNQHLNTWCNSMNRISFNQYYNKTYGGNK